MKFMREVRMSIRIKMRLKSVDVIEDYVLRAILDSMMVRESIVLKNGPIKKVIKVEKKNQKRI